jgi:hypothetical protein
MGGIFIEILNTTSQMLGETLRDLFISFIGIGIFKFIKKIALLTASLNDLA